MSADGILPADDLAQVNPSPPKRIQSPYGELVLDEEPSTAPPPQAAAQPSLSLLQPPRGTPAAAPSPDQGQPAGAPGLVAPSRVTQVASSSLPPAAASPAVVLKPPSAGLTPAAPVVLKPPSAGLTPAAPVVLKPPSAGLTPAAPTSPDAATISPDELVAEPTTQGTIHSPYGDLVPESSIAPRAPAPAPESENSLERGFKVAAHQLPQMLGGALMFGGDLVRKLGDDHTASGVFKFLDPDNVGQALMDYGQGLYKRETAATDALAKPSDSFSYVMHHPSELGSWMAYGLGYGGGQALQALAGMAIGAVAGSEFPGLGNVVGAGVGLVARKSLERVIAKKAAELMAADAAKYATRDAAEAAARQVVQKSLARKVGAATAAQALNETQEIGTVYTSAVDQANAEGKTDLSAGDLMRIGLMGTAAAGVDTLADIVNLHAVLKGAKPIDAAAGDALRQRLVNGLREVRNGALREGGTEAVQTVLERAGAAQPITDAAGIQDIVDSTALGAISGAAAGAAAGLHAGAAKAAAPAEPAPADRGTPDYVGKWENARTELANRQGDATDPVNAEDNQAAAAAVTELAARHGVSVKDLTTPTPPPLTGSLGDAAEAIPPGYSPTSVAAAAAGEPAEAVGRIKPQVAAGDVMDHAFNRLHALTRKAVGTPGRMGEPTTDNPTGVIPAVAPRALAPAEEEERQFLSRNLKNPQALADRLGVDLAPGTEPSTAEPGPAKLTDAQYRPPAPPWVDQQTGEATQPTDTELTNFLAIALADKFQSTGNMRGDNADFAAAWGIPRITRATRTKANALARAELDRRAESARAAQTIAAEAANAAAAGPAGTSAAEAAPAAAPAAATVEPATAPATAEAAGEPVAVASAPAAEAATGPAAAPPVPETAQAQPTQAPSATAAGLLAPPLPSEAQAGTATGAAGADLAAPAAEAPHGAVTAAVAAPRTTTLPETRTAAQPEVPAAPPATAPTAAAQPTEPAATAPAAPATPATAAAAAAQPTEPAATAPAAPATPATAAAAAAQPTEPAATAPAAPATPAAQPEPQALQFGLSRQDGRLVVHGDVTAIRDRLARGGVAAQGRVTPGGLSFPIAQGGAVRRGLGATAAEQRPPGSPESDNVPLQPSERVFINRGKYVGQGGSVVRATPYGVQVELDRGSGRHTFSQNIVSRVAARTAEVEATPARTTPTPTAADEARETRQNVPQVARPTAMKGVTLEVATLHGTKRIRAKLYELPAYTGPQLAVATYKSARGLGYRVYLVKSGTLLADNNGVGTLADVLTEAVTRVRGLRQRGSGGEAAVGTAPPGVGAESAATPNPPTRRARLDALIARYNASGRSATHYPRQNRVSVDGRSMTEDAAREKMTAVLDATGPDATAPANAAVQARGREATPAGPLMAEDAAGAAVGAQPGRAKAASAHAPNAPITDFGEKIGNARKDTAGKSGPRAARAATDETEAAATQPTWAKRYRVARIDKSMQAAEEGRYAIYDKRRVSLGSEVPATRTTFATQAEAEAAIPLLALARNTRVGLRAGGNYAIYRNVTDRKRVVLKDGFASEDDAKRYMTAHAAELLDQKTSVGEEALPKPETLTREGPERRTGDVAPQQFMNVLGMRAVEFGNWNNQAERQEVMNHAYDGLLDLAEVLGIPPKAISLNGELALAFGARGQGLSGARAHYEPQRVVMNLTKMQGAGALAHEWFHALDYYLGRQTGRVKSDVTRGAAGERVIRGANNADAATYNTAAASAMREELRQAYKSLIDTMQSKAKQYTVDSAQVEKFVGHARGGLEYYLTQLRNSLDRAYPYGAAAKRAPATAEQLAEVDAIASELLAGHGLTLQAVSNKPTASARISVGVHLTNDKLDRLSAILKAVRGRSGFAKQGGVMVDIANAMRRYEARLKELAKAAENPERTGSEPTSFRMEAVKADQGRGTNYWTTPHEMAARAFSAYVEDKLAAEGRSSDFLSFGSDGRFVLPIPEFPHPFPQGEERVAIDKAFDTFFKAVKTQETENGNVALFSRSTSPVVRGRMAVEEVQKVARGVLGVDPEKAGVGIVASFSALPDGVRRAVQAEGVHDGDIDALHWRGKSWILADMMRDPAHVAEALFHEHYTHGGLRAAFGRELGAKLDSLVDGLGGLDDVHKMAETQGIDLAAYDTAQAADRSMAEADKRRQLMEELLAHMSALTGTLRRTAQEWLGAVRDFMRRHGFAALAGYNAADLALVLRQAREAAGQLAATKGRPTFQRASGAEGAEAEVPRGAEPANPSAPAFSLADERARATAPPFYSALLRAVDTAKGAPRVAKASQWSEWLDGAQRRGEIKQSEREWLGVDDWLNAQKRPVGKDELAAFIRGNQVQVRAVDKAAMYTKYLDYTLPGAADYHELLLTLPHAPTRAELSDRDAVFQREMHAKYGDGWRNKATADELATSATLDRAAESAVDVPPDFSSPHFDEPNVLVHVRFDTRTTRQRGAPDAPQQKTLFIEEIQSDWHQAGRKRGYFDPKRPWDVFRTLDGKATARFATEAEAEAEAKRLGADFDFANAAEDEEPPRSADAPFKKTDQWSMLAFKRMVRYAAENGYERIAWTTGAQQAARYDLGQQFDHVSVARRVDAMTGEASRRVALEGHGTPIYLGVGNDGVVDSVRARGGAQLGALRGEPLDAVVGKELAAKIMASDGMAVFAAPDLQVGGHGMRAFYDDMLPNAVNKWAKPFGTKVGTSVIDTQSADAITRREVYDGPMPSVAEIDAVANDDAATASVQQQLRRVAAAMRSGRSFADAMEREASVAAANALGGTMVAASERPVTVHSLDITPKMRDAALGGQPLFNVDESAAGGRVAPAAHVAFVQKTVDAMTKGWGQNAPVTRVVASAEELPAEAKTDQRYKRAGGYYGNGVGWIVAPNVSSRAAVARALTHEVIGHYGVEQIAENELGPGAWAEITTAVQNMRARVAEKQSANRLAGRAQNAGLSHVQSVIAETVRRYGASTDPTTFARETLAVLSEHGIRNSWVDRVVKALRQFLRRMMPNLHLSGAELQQLLVASDKYLHVQDLRPAATAPSARTTVPAVTTPVVARPQPAFSLASFAQRVREWFARPTRGGAPLQMGRTTAVLRMLGAPALPLEITPAVMEKVAAAKHAISQGVLERLPELLDEPLAVYDSHAEGAKPGSLVVAVGALDRDGARVVVAIAPAVSAAGQPVLEVNRVSSVYGKDDGDWFRREARAGRARYANTEKAMGRQVSSDDALFRTDERGGPQLQGHSLLTQADLRKYRADERSKALDRGGDVGAPPAFSLPDASADAINEVLEHSDETALNRVKGWLSGKWEDLKPVTLGALNLRHLLELMEAHNALKGASQYADLNQRMEADRNSLLSGAPDAAEHPDDMLKRGAAPLTHEWQKWAFQKGWKGMRGHVTEAAKELARIMNDATLAGLDPSEEYTRLQMDDGRGGFEEWSRAAVAQRIKVLREQMRGRAGDDKREMTDEIKQLRGLAGREKRREEQWPALVARYNALSPEAKEIYKNTRDWYSQQADASEQALVERIGLYDVPETYKRSMVDRVRRQFERNRLEGVYFPLDRNGEYWISVTDARGQQGFKMFENAAAFKRGAMTLRARGFTITAMGRDDQNYHAKDAPSGTFVKDIVGILKQAGASEKLQDQIYQMFLKTLPEMSMRTRQIHRRGIPGFDDNALRAFAKNSFHGSYQLARLRYGQRMQNVVEAMESNLDQFRRAPTLGASTTATASEVAKADALLSELRRRHEWIMNPTDNQLASRITSIGFMYYLGMSPASALVNLTQGAQVTLPVLGGRHGFARAGRVLLATTAAAMRTGGNMERTLTDPDEKRAYRVLVTRGDIDRTNAHTLAGVAEGDMLAMNPTWQRVMRGMSWMFHTAEIINREAAGMAAYRLARMDGKDFNDAVQYASDIVNGTQFDYSNAARPRWMQKGWQKVLFQFKNYSYNMTWVMYRNLYLAFKGETPEVRKAAAKTFTGIMGVTAVLSGLIGLPLINGIALIANAAQAAFGDPDEPWDFLTQFRKWLDEMFGDGIGSMVADGAVDKLGLHLSTRVSLSNLWFGAVDTHLEGKDAYHQFLESIAGPLGGLAQNTMFVGPQQIAQGHLWRGIETMLPAFAKNGMRSVRYAAEGVNTLRGDPIIDDPTAAEDVFQALGFQPTRIAAAWRGNVALLNAQREVQDRRQSLMNAFAVALAQGDTSGRAAVLERITAFNRKWPQYPISADTLRRSLRMRANYSQQAEHGVKLAPRLEARLREMTGVAKDDNGG